MKKIWASVGELKEMFPGRWATSPNSQITGNLKRYVERGLIARKLDTVILQNGHGPCRVKVWHYRVSDVQAYLRGDFLPQKIDSLTIQ